MLRREDYIKFYHLRAYDRINAPYRTLFLDLLSRLRDPAFLSVLPLDP